MSKKENVNIIRPNDFESIDEELTQAMALLDESNTRVLDVLSPEPEETGPPVEAPVLEGTDTPARGGEETKEEGRKEGD